MRSSLAGVSDEAFSRAWAAAASNGFSHTDEKSGELHFLLYSALSVLNHSCAPNACLDDTEPEARTSVYAIRDVRAGEEITICCALGAGAGFRRRSSTVRCHTTWRTIACPPVSLTPNST